MGNQYNIRRSPEYIEHALFGKKTANTGTTGAKTTGSSKGQSPLKGTQKKNHLYWARAWINDGWKYAYNAAQVKWLQNFGKGRKDSLWTGDKETHLKKLNAAKRNLNASKSSFEKSRQGLKDSYLKSENDFTRAASNAVANAGAKVKYGIKTITDENFRRSQHDPTAYDAEEAELSRYIRDTGKAAKSAAGEMRDDAVAVVKRTADKVANANSVTRHVANKAEEAKDKAEFAVRTVFDKNFRQAGKDPTKYDARREALEKELKEDAAASSKSGEALKNDINKVTGGALDKAKAAGEAVKKTANAAGEAAKKTANAAGEALKKGADAAENAINKATDGGIDKLKAVKAYNAAQKKIDKINKKMEAEILKAYSADVNKDMAALSAAREEYIRLQEELNAAKAELSAAEPLYNQTVKDINDGKAAIEAAFKSAGSIATSTLAGAKDAANKGKEWLDGAFGAAGEKAKGALGAAKTALGTAGEKAKGALGAAGEKAKGAINAVGERVSGAKESAKNAIDAVGERVSGAKESAKNAIDTAGERVKGAVDSVGERISGAKDSAKNAIDAAGERVKDTVSDAKENIKNLGASAKENINNVATNAKSQVGSTINDTVIERGKALLDDLLNRGNATESTAQTTTAENTSEAQSKIKELASEAGKKVSEKISSAKEKLDAALDKLKGLGNKASESERSSTLDEAKEAYEQIEAAAKDKVDAIVDAYGKDSPQYQAAKKTYEEVDKMGQAIRGGQYGWYTHTEQVNRMMAEGISKADAELFAYYAEASHDLHRSMTEEEYQDFINNYDEEKAREAAHNRRHGG